MACKEGETWILKHTYETGLFKSLSKKCAQSELFAKAYLWCQFSNTNDSRTTNLCSTAIFYAHPEGGDTRAHLKWTVCFTGAYTPTISACRFGVPPRLLGWHDQEA